MKNIFLTLLLCLASAPMAQTAPPLAAPPVPAKMGVVRWTCHAFYLPARSIWQRTVDVDFDEAGVRAVQIDGVLAYTFNMQDTTILTAVDGERIQFDVAAQTWTSDLRGLATSKGGCSR